MTARRREPQIKEQGDDTWMKRARCKTIPLTPRQITTLMFPTKEADVARAKKVCEGCPVQKECLDFAMRNRYDDGVWGGKSERERDTIRRYRYRQARKTQPA